VCFETPFLSGVRREKNRELGGPETEEAMEYRQSEKLSVLKKTFMNKTMIDFEEINTNPGFLQRLIFVKDYNKQ
jgi:hypothetical protein